MLQYFKSVTLESSYLGWQESTVSSITVFLFIYLQNKAPEEEEEVEEVPVKKEKTHFLVKLVEMKAEDKVKLIKEVKNCIEGINLVQVSVDFTTVSRNLFLFASRLFN